jgi:hypothetical protein
VISNVTQDLANKNSLFFILLKKLDFFYRVLKILSRFLTTYYCKMSNHDTPYERKYAVGACFLCQHCFYCESKLTFIKCECNLSIKPTLKHTGKEKRTLYSRLYNPKTKHTVYNTLQLKKLKEANQIYSYNINFLSKFNFSLCSVCHNVMIKLKRNSSTSKSNLSKSTKSTLKKTSKSVSNRNVSKNKSKSLDLDQSEELTRIIYDISSDDNEGEEEILIFDDEASKHELNKEDNIEEQSENTDTEIATEIDDNLNVEESEEEEILSEISFKLIIKQEKENSAAKWEVINLTTFKVFKKELNFLIQNQLDRWVIYDDYIVSYKLGREAGSGTQLSDERDWKRFLAECQKSNLKKKEIIILATFKSRKNDSKIDKKRLVI